MNSRKHYRCSLSAQPQRNRGVQHHFVVVAEGMADAFIRAMEFWTEQFDTDSLVAPDRVVITAADAYPPLGENHDQ